MFAEYFAGLSGAFGTFADAPATWPGTPVTDDGGSITSPGEPASHDCRVQIDAATQAMRSSPGFLETDVRLLVLRFAVPLDTKARVTVGGAAYELLSCQSDPAGIGWECRGRLCR
jgi:hypothetical protein